MIPIQFMNHESRSSTHYFDFHDQWKLFIDGKNCTKCFEFRRSWFMKLKRNIWIHLLGGTKLMGFDSIDNVWSQFKHWCHSHDILYVLQQFIENVAKSQHVATPFQFTDSWTNMLKGPPRLTLEWTIWISRVTNSSLKGNI